ncbi:MAG TPA: hypothetical protein VF529_18610 [Solirubrobacteraceae bacterium]
MREFVDEHWIRLPRAPVATFLGVRPFPAWREQMVETYQREYRSLAVEVCEEAVELEALAKSALLVVQGGSASQIKLLPDLFDDAAKHLDRLAADVAD